MPSYRCRCLSLACWFSLVVVCSFVVCPRPHAQEKSMEQLLQQLKSAVLDERLSALEALERRGPDSEPALDLVAGRACNPQAVDKERKAALRVLYAMGNKAAPVAPALVGLLQSEAQQEVADVLAAIGDKSVQHLLAALQKDDNRVNYPFRLAATRALGDIGNKAEAARYYFSYLLRELEDASDDQPKAVRRETAFALVRIHPQEYRRNPELRQVLSQTLGESEFSTRLAAAEHVARLGAQAREMSPRLVQLFKDRRWQIRRAAVEALVAISAPEPLTSLVADPGQLLWDEADCDRLRRDIRLGAALALAKLANPAADHLLNVVASGLESDDIEVRAYAMQTLQAAPRQSVPALVGLLRSGGWQGRLAAIETIGNLGADGRDASTDLLRMLVHPQEDEMVRAAAATSLARLQVREAVPAMIAVLGDAPRRNWLVAAATARALGKLAATEAERVVPLLLRSLNDPAGEWEWKLALIEAVGELLEDSLSDRSQSPAHRQELTRLAVRALYAVWQVRAEYPCLLIETNIDKTVAAIERRLTHIWKQAGGNDRSGTQAQPAEIRRDMRRLLDNGNDFARCLERLRTNITREEIPVAAAKQAVTKPATPVAPQQQPPTPTAPAAGDAMPANIWQACWNESGQYFDFTQDAWVNLAHDKQFDYAQAYQAWYAKTKGLQIEKTVSGMAMRLIPPGKFWMGSPDGESNRESDETRHKVLIAKPYYIGKTEVTQAEWLGVVGGDNPAYFKGDILPVENVSWDMCQGFCQKAGVKLPSEAQWEYACRAGVTSAYNLSNSESDLVRAGWYTSNSGSTTHPVGQKTATAWGCYDFHGNVWEWCQDWYHDSYNGAPADGSAWEIPTGSGRVMRGGSWTYSARYLRSAYRNRVVPSYCYYDLGLRSVFEARAYPENK